MASKKPRKTRAFSDSPQPLMRFSGTRLQSSDLDVLQEALIGLRQQKESEAEDAKMLLAWIYKTKKEVDL